MADADDLAATAAYIVEVVGAPVVRANGKAPLDPGWPQARTDPDLWATKLVGHVGNVGVVGGDGLVVLDFDTQKPEGLAALIAMSAAGLLPATLTVRTPSGGMHFYYHHDKATHIGCGTFAGIALPDGTVLDGGAEYKGSGGFVVCPPSINVDTGVAYRWDDTCGLGTPIAELHPHLLEALAGPGGHGTGGWSAYQAGDVDEATAEAVGVLVERFGGHSPTVHPVTDANPWVSITRPGKRGADGSSVTVGFLGPGLTKVWSDNWPPFRQGEVVDLGTLRRRAGIDDGRTIRIGDDKSTPFTVADQTRSMRQVWLWTDHLPAAQLVIAAGQEKLGKSTAMVWVSARLTKGELPGDLEGSPVNVAFISAEDDNEHILKPRAAAAGADLARLFFLNPRGPGFSLSSVRELHPALVVLDPLSAFITLKGSNEHGEIAVRQALEPFNALAQDDGVTVIGVRHVRKSPPGDNPFDAILGSRAWSAAARAVLFFTPDAEHKDRPGGLIFPRGNLARPAGGSRYRLESVKVLLDDGNVDDFPLFTLEDGGVGIDLDEALGPRENVTARRDAEEFLLTTLAEGAVLADDVLRMAGEEGITEKTLRRAKKDLGVISDRSGFGKGSTVSWRLP